MGWFGKNALARAQSKQQGKFENAITEDEIPTTDGSIAEEATEANAGDDKRHQGTTESSPHHDRDATVTLTPRRENEGPTATMRLANGVRNALRIGSPSSHHKPSPATAHCQEPGHNRKTSITVSARSVASSVLSSPILGTFTLPPPVPVPPVATSAPVTATSTTSEPQNDDDVRTMSQISVASATVSVAEGEAASMLSSSRSPPDQSEELALVQGSSLRALFNATRVMSSEPSSILVDHGQDVGELVTRLAWELIVHVRDSGITFKEPTKPKVRGKAPLSVPEHAMMDGGVEQNGDGKRKSRAAIMARKLSVSMVSSTGTVEKVRKPSGLGTLANPLLIGLGAGSFKAKVASTNLREEVVAGPAAVSAGPTGPSPTSVSPGPTAGALSVALESIIPATAKPPTQYLARTYTSLVSPDFKPPTSFGGFTGDRFATRQDADGREPITDRYGFVYEVSSYDVLLLDRALRAGNSAPGCLTGIKVADREEDDDWPLGDDAERTREFEVVRGSCDCKDGARLNDEATSEERKEQDPGNGESEVASLVSISSSSKQSSKRLSQSIKPSRAIALSAPLKIASLDFLPVVEESMFVPNHACPNTVRALVARLTDMHDKKQAKLKSEWDTFLRVRRDMKPVKASPISTRPAALSSSAAAMLGLGSRGTDDVEELRQSEGLVGFSQMGLVSNQNERKAFGRLVRNGIPLVYRAKVWLECSGALEMAEPGSFRDLLEDAVKEGGIAITEIEKDVGRTMPLNVFFGGDGVGVDKLRRVLRAYSR